VTPQSHFEREDDDLAHVISLSLQVLKIPFNSYMTQFVASQCFRFLVPIAFNLDCRERGSNT